MSECVAWPNIALVQGRLYGLGAPLCLPVGCEVFGIDGISRDVGGRQVRPLEPCPVTGPDGREWLKGSETTGYMPAMVGNEVVMLPTSFPSLRPCDR